MMLGVQILIEEIATLLVADAGSLGSATALKVLLYDNDVVITPATLMADLTEITFDGYAALAAGAAPQLYGYDPLTNELLITIKEPAGGWRWSTTGATGLPKTVHGFALTNGAKTILFGAQALTPAVTLTASLQEIDIGSVNLRLPLQPLT